MLVTAQPRPSTVGRWRPVPHPTSKQRPGPGREGVGSRRSLRDQTARCSRRTTWRTGRRARASPFDHAIACSIGVLGGAASGRPSRYQEWGIWFPRVRPTGALAELCPSRFGLRTAASTSDQSALERDSIHAAAFARPEATTDGRHLGSASSRGSQRKRSCSSSSTSSASGGACAT
jgi:hypothetical protein